MTGPKPVGTAAQRSRLAWDRTALAAAALAGLLLKVGIDRSRTADIVAGVGAGLFAAAIAVQGQLRSRSGHCTTAVVCTAALINVVALLTIVALFL
jgi:hypothetical protein